MRAQVSSAILDAAATVFAEHGDSASMADVAAAAGVGRATLYRYFDSRESLTHALAFAAIEELELRLVEADLDQVPVPLAIERMARAMVACGIKFAVVRDVRQHLDKAELDRRIGSLIRAVFRRGVADGTLRDDIPIDLLAGIWGGSLAAALRWTSQPDGSVERASAAISNFFLQGAGRH
ncbi:MAG: TetR/AcrR family transcriptional regulator [Acidimicrobiaceae bacterium]|nr:TetR/AcrR family transcriptional regulator [Acidimicrobiaceae bacterium]